MTVNTNLNMPLSKAFRRLKKAFTNYRVFSDEAVRQIAKDYLQKEKGEALPVDIKIFYSFLDDEWNVHLAPQHRPGRWITISDETGEVTGYFNPPR